MLVVRQLSIGFLRCLMVFMAKKRWQRSACNGSGIFLQPTGNTSKTCRSFSQYVLLSGESADSDGTEYDT